MSDHVDGNVLAGPFADLFTPDLTVAIAVCAGCGRAERLAAVAVYGAPMGLIARCTGCEEVLLRYAESPAARTLDMRGIAALRISTAEPS